MVHFFNRTPTKSATIVMDGKTRVLRDRIKSVKVYDLFSSIIYSFMMCISIILQNTRRITEAMRLVAAARVRRAQDAVLKTRPLIAQLQLVSSG